MALILCLETSGPLCCVSLQRDEVLLGEKRADKPNEHARLLTLLISELLTACGVQPGNLQAIAYSAGPGSYTGLRIGASVAKGMCYTLNVPLISIPSHAITAGSFFEIHQSSATVSILSPARQGQCYVTDFQKPVTGMEQTAVWHTTEPPLFSHLPAADLWQKNKLQLPASVASMDIQFVPFHAGAFGELAQAAYRQTAFADLAHSEPYYVGGWGRGGH